MWVPLATKFNKFRENLGIPPIDIRTGGALVHDRQIPHMYCWSATVLPKPSDWPEYISVTGYWFLDSPSSWKPPAELLVFLKKEPKPVYIGFGSVTVN
jgi:sterol 3beta-glucosyltransferase